MFDDIGEGPKESGDLEKLMLLLLLWFRIEESKLRLLL